MKIKNVRTKKEDEKIDEEVIRQASDGKAWSKETRIAPKTRPTSIRLSPRTIERAKFFARVHKERGYQSWLKKIVEERINTEYELYRRLKQEVV